MGQIPPVPEIYIVSGGVGASAEQLVSTILAQYPANAVNFTTFGNTRLRAQVDSTLAMAQSKDALVVHTLVDANLRAYLVDQAFLKGLRTIDLMGPVMDWITSRIGIPPLAQPGLYRQHRRAYFDRIAAIDFTMAHDDGKNPDGWKKAELVLMGVSRVGKTPLSLYLAVLGWKVANIPIVPGIPVNAELEQVDRRCIFGVTLDPDQLLAFRYQRQIRLGVNIQSDYIDPEVIQDEIKSALRLFNQRGIQVLDMTDKTIEIGADEIIRRMNLK